LRALIDAACDASVSLLTRQHSYLYLIVAFLLFGLPLFAGLNGADLRNDEAIYSYSVDRILETGEWLTPRSIEVDGPFVEKPPLKLWLVAGAMRLGVPQDERGQRILDALFGALAFVYICALGQWLAGPVCGISAVLLLFALDRLVLEHGLRTNNMEAALMLAYCGGVFHFAKWEASPDDRSGRRHALIATTFFVLGFLTKFVAALFLPALCFVAYAWSVGARQSLVAAWRAWRGPAILMVALVAPWFIYQSWQLGTEFWQVILGRHVVTRFTASLDPQHLHPWHYYYTETWKELSRERAGWTAVAGLVALAIVAWRGRPPLARLILSWAIVPYLLLSAGTSKLFHYVYPFLPAIALAAGFVCALLSQAVVNALVWLSHRLRPPAAAVRLRLAIRGANRVRVALVAAAVACIVIEVWTYASGTMAWTMNDTIVFRNSSLVRPLVIAAVLLWLASLGRHAMQTLALVPLVLLLPVYDYPATIMKTTMERHPLRALRDCSLLVRESAAPSGDGIYNLAPALTYHSYYYYLHRLGAWTVEDSLKTEELRRRLFEHGAQTPVLISIDDYEAIAPGVTPSHAPGGSRSATRAVTISSAEQVLILLPGPYSACVKPMLQAGGQLAQVNHSAAGTR
jgi:4-amino-4-deoxy-L-arabinose transferase-like glycosyltransferase